MRYQEIKTLLEYDRSKTIQALSNGILRAAQHDSYLKSRNLDDEQTVAAVIDAAESADPTPNEQYVQWIVRQFTKKGMKYEDLYKLEDDLKTFVSTKGQHKRLGINSDINSYNWKTLADVSSKLSDTDVADPEQASASEIPDVKVLYDGPLGTLSIPETETASCTIGSGSRWCTAAKKNNMFNHYSKYGPLYVWVDKKRKDKYQFHFETGQFMDSSDQPLTLEDAAYFIDRNPITKKLFNQKQDEMYEVLDHLVNYVDREPEYDVEYGDWITSESEPLQDMATEANFSFLLHMLPGDDMVYYYKKADEYLGSDIRKILKNDEQKRRDFEDKFIKNSPKAAQQLATKLYGKNPVPHLEDLIATDGISAYLYAFHNLGKQRFKKGEPEIAKHAWAATYYVKNILKQRWPEAEPAIKKYDAHWKTYQAAINEN